MKNRSKVVIKTLNQEKLFNNLSKVLKIYNLKRLDSNKVEFEVDFVKYQKLKKFLKSNKIEILFSSHRGFLFLFKKLFSRGGVVSALIFSLILYSFQYFIVWDCYVNGIEEKYKNEILTYVKKECKGVFKWRINTKDLEMKVKNNFSSVSSISVAIIGQSVVININQKNIPDEMKDSFSPLISEYNGIITKINLIQGTLNCKVGDIVKSGDVIVYPYVIDSQGEKRNVQPKADIFADIWLKGESYHYDYRLKTERTGKKITLNYVLLNNLQIYKQSKIISFEDYQIEESKNCISKNLLLPMFLVKKTYYQIETKEIKESFEDVKDKIFQEAKQKALIFLQENEIILKENYTVKDAGGCHYVCYNATINRNIGGRNDS